jgi:ethanolamine utilization protein EutJ
MAADHRGGPHNPMNPELDSLLERTDDIMAGKADGWRPDPDLISPAGYRGKLFTGVDLGTAYTVLVVLDENKQPIGGAYRFAQVVRDGLVVDFVGAVDLLRELKAQVEARLGVSLASAASAYPPGVAQVEVRATANVLRAAGLECTGLIDEPTAANNVLQVRDGAVVDVGGGTTGVAVFRQGQVVYTADEPTGGTHFSLVIAGALDISFEAAEELKKDSRQQPRLFPIIRPVMEKVATIVRRHVAGFNVDTLYLVGGTSAYPGIGPVVEEITGVRTVVPDRPLFVTPLGIAMTNEQ